MVRQGVQINRVKAERLIAKRNVRRPQRKERSSENEELNTLKGKVSKIDKKSSKKRLLLIEKIQTKLYECKERAEKKETFFEGLAGQYAALFTQASVAHWKIEDSANDSSANGSRKGSRRQVSSARSIKFSSDFDSEPTVVQKAPEKALVAPDTYLVGVASVKAEVSVESATPATGGDGESSVSAGDTPVDASEVGATLEGGSAGIGESKSPAPVGDAPADMAGVKAEASVESDTAAGDEGKSLAPAENSAGQESEEEAPVLGAQKDGEEGKRDPSADGSVAEDRIIEVNSNGLIEQSATMPLEDQDKGKDLEKAAGTSEENLPEDNGIAQYGR